MVPLTSSNLDPSSPEDGYNSAFLSWETRASLFAGTWLRDRDLFPQGGAYWTQKHSLIGLADDAGAAPSSQAQACDFLLYNSFTLSLEDGPVDRVCRRISDGGYAWAPTSMREDARRIILDESFHGLFSAQLGTIVQERSGLYLPHLSSTLNTRLNEVLEQVDPNFHALGELLFVICSETLVTSTLGELAQDSSLFPAIRSALRDHARDEGRHRAFFKSCSRKLWAQLSEAERDLCAHLLPRLLHVYLAPDVKALTTVLSVLPGIKDCETSAHIISRHPTHSAACAQAAHHAARVFQSLDARRFRDAEVELFKLLG